MSSILERQTGGMNSEENELPANRAQEKQIPRTRSASGSENQGKATKLVAGTEGHRRT
jgi:hypothetical protein